MMKANLPLPFFESLTMRSFVYRAPSRLPHPFRRATDPFFCDTPVETTLHHRAPLVLNSSLHVRTITGVTPGNR